MLRKELPEFVFLLREFESWNSKMNDVLYKKRQSDNTTTHLVLPRDLRESVFKNLHDDMGHLGVE